MIYECDQCGAALPPGVNTCPKCGDMFEETVPSDATIPTRGFTARPDVEPPPLPAEAYKPPPLPTEPDEWPLFVGHDVSPSGPATLRSVAESRPKIDSDVMRSLAIGGGLLGLVLLLGLLSHLRRIDPDTAAPSQASSALVVSKPPAPKPSPPLTAAQKHAAAAHAQAEKLAQRREARREARARREQQRQADEAARAERQAQEQQAEAQRQDEEAYARIKVKLRQDYPDSYITQKTLYDANVEAYQYMKTVPDDEVKQRLEQDYPDSYITQKTLYDANIEAKQQLDH